MLGPRRPVCWSAVFVAAVVASVSGRAEEAARRTFRMGFTAFPHDFSLSAVAEAQRFVRENADIVAHHIEGVPWAEALEGAPFQEEMLEEWRGKKAAAPANGKTYLAVPPGRGGLKVAEKGLPMPPELAGAAYDHPLVRQAYLAYCRRAFAFFQPDYMAIGIEVNEIYAAGPDKWRAYLVLHEHVYRKLKEEHPNLPVFASFTLHGMLNARGEARQEMLRAYQQLMPYNDVVAVSFYPFIAGGTTQIASALAWMTDNFDRFEKPYAVVETGEAAQRLVFPESKQVIHGTPEKQAAYYRELLAVAQARHFAFIITFVHRDYDALWEKMKSGAPEAFMAWRDCGLLDEDGVPRPAYALWQKYFRMPLEAP